MEKEASSADTCPFARPLVASHSFQRGPSISIAFFDHWDKTQGAGEEASENHSFRDISLHGGTMWCSRSYIMVARKQ